MSMKLLGYINMGSVVTDDTDQIFYFSEILKKKGVE